MSNRAPKSWICPACQSELGQVLYGELYIKNASDVNTDGVNLVVMCKSCGNRKIWYAQDRLTEIMRLIAEEVARQVVNRIEPKC